MSMKHMYKGVVVALMVAGLAACASKQTEDTSGDTAPVVQENTTTPVTTGPSATELARLQDIEARKSRVVYFGFDDANIQPEARDLLALHGAFLAKNSGVMVQIEGHCDERGTPEYNVALGERRAKAVAQVLMSYGVQASQIKNISFGEEKPAVMGHDESAWMKNRRGVLVYEG